MLQGHPLPDATLKAVEKQMLFSLQLSSSLKYDGAAVRPEQGLLALRGNNLYANIRPVKIFDSLKRLCRSTRQKLQLELLCECVS